MIGMPKNARLEYVEITQKLHTRVSIFMRSFIFKLGIMAGSSLLAASLSGQTQPHRFAPEDTARGTSAPAPARRTMDGRPAARLQVAAQSAAAGPNLTVDAAANRHAISPDVYGINSYGLGSTSMFYDLRLPVTRWGGDATSEYNWKLDKTNSGSDWYFEVFAQTSATQVPPFDPATHNGSAFDRFHETNLQSGAKSVGTIPVLDWVAGDFPDKTCGHDIRKYPNQKTTQINPGTGRTYVDPYGPNCGSGIDLNGKAITSNDPRDTDIQVDESFMTDWVRHVTGKYGAAAQGGVAIWELDNEPVWWSGVHQSVHPASSNYDEIVSRGLRYAAAVKAADPTAAVAGPITAGWSDLFFSNVDLFAGWNSRSPVAGGEDWKYWNNPTDRKAHGDSDFAAYYLQQFAAYEKQNGKRLLDYFDVHGYMPGTSLSGTDDATNAKRLQSIRVFWDPNFILYGNPIFNGDSDEYLLNANPQWQTPQCVCLIPRMKQWVANNYPGTKMSITEYILGAESTLNGGLAQADLLGAFGREGLDLATLWGSKTIQPAFPVAYAFKMYRNYDGQGGAFGETSISAASDNQDQLSVYAAERSDSALTLMVINKTANDLSSNISLNNFQPDSAAQVWQYSGANLAAIVRGPDVSATPNGITATFPANSATLLIVPSAASALKAPKPVISAVLNAASGQAAIAPGTVVKITGSNLGPASGAAAPIPATSGFVNSNLSNVAVFFNGAPAPVLSASSGTVLAVVPYSAALNSTSTVQVQYLGSRSDAFQAQVAASAPGVFTADGTGQGPALAFAFDSGLSILALNSSLNPATSGSSLFFYMTGAGVLNPPAVDGRIESSIRPGPAQTLSVTIGGKSATVQAASAPGSVSGILLVNATVPSGVPAGNAALVVTVGSASSQSGVTLAVK